MQKRLAMEPQLQNGGDFDFCCGIVSKNYEVCVHISVYIISVCKAHIPITILMITLDTENHQAILLPFPSGKAMEIVRHRVSALRTLSLKVLDLSGMILFQTL